MSIIIKYSISTIKFNNATFSLFRFFPLLIFVIYFNTIPLFFLSNPWVEYFQQISYLYYLNQICNNNIMYKN